MRYHMVTTLELLFLSLTIGLVSSILISCFSLYMDWRLLPVVYTDANGACLKVENYENGHAFNCEDVDVILRRYRTPNETLPKVRLYSL